MSCPSCGTALAEGASRCSACGQALGEANRCPACTGLSAVREVASRRHVCAACGAERRLLPGTALLADFGDAQEKRVRRLAWAARFLAFGAWVLLAVGALLSGVIAVFGGQLFWLPGALTLPAVAVTLYLSRRLRSESVGLAQVVVDNRLLAEVSGHARGVSVADAAGALARRQAEVDRDLTRLAKAGRLVLDVTDAGELRYRVPSEEDGAAAGEIVPRLDALRKGDEFE